jgi:hypothetical protein
VFPPHAALLTGMSAKTISHAEARQAAFIGARPHQYAPGFTGTIQGNGLKEEAS